MPNALHRLDYVVLLCTDLERMRAFYRDVMRMPLAADSDQWVELRLDNLTFVLWPRGRSYDGPSGAIGSVAVQLAFRVEVPEVDEWHRELVRNGVEIVEAPTDQSWGHRTLFSRDPEGALIEIYAEI
ncbi:MAG TPA: VOC family protein [Candidatus Binataceae bacterium]